MTLDQLNELINRGGVAFGLGVIALLLILIYENMRRSSRKSKR